MNLRPYQADAVDATWNYIRNNPKKNPCLRLPTAAGKSVILGKIADDAVVKWRGRVLVLAHRKELVAQNVDKIRRINPALKVGIYSAGLDSRETDAPVIVAGIQSVYTRAAELGRFDIIVIDEAHLIPPEGDGQYRRFLREAQAINPKLRVIGLTATAFRLDGPICRADGILNEICYDVNERYLIARGYISNLRTKEGRSGANLDGMHIRNGEFTAEDVESAVDTDAVVDVACRDLVELSVERKSVLVFCASVKHCERVAARLRELTRDEVAVVTGETPYGERDEALARFRREARHNVLGEALPPVRFLVNCGVLTTGFDAPNTDCVALLRPTASPGLYVQMVGRGFRLSPETGKQDCLVLDFGRNVERHGPVDAVRPPSEPSERNKDRQPLTKTCEQCREIVPRAVRICPCCGYEFPAPQRGGGLVETASGASILSGTVTDAEHKVKAVTYEVHRKYGAPDDAPKTVQVEYHCGLFDVFKEWLCPEHQGFARSKFEAWWREHAPGCSIPDTAEDCYLQCLDGNVRSPTMITVRTTEGEQFPHRVIGYGYDKPADEHETPGAVEPAAENPENRPNDSLPDWAKRYFSKQQDVDDLPF